LVEAERGTQRLEALQRQGFGARRSAAGLRLTEAGLIPSALE
jgi:hypothetical protein